MQTGIERLGNFLESVRFPVSVRATSTVSGIPEEYIETVLKDSDFVVINDKIYGKGILFLNKSSVNMLQELHDSMGMVVRCEDGMITGHKYEGMEEILDGQENEVGDALLGIG